ncbi:P-loop NTPase fold protein [Oxalobacteraceae bacterium R-40]|uniref:P-loop NTPase fold protein n=1 Tax=Keguizhuia sedimenti TaxID=3064264 RepID=A0ABU1BJ20_9BURK|nr:P-loop NTPase fold protein [Oxalobacteraceae bacterium R-40]
MMKTNDRILASINSYIASPTTNYAVMLSGSWGAGKTHFWKHRIIPIAEELGFKPVYVSLYGIQAPEEVNRLIAYAMLPILNKKFTKAAGFALGGVASFFNVDLNKFKPEDFITAASKAVLCFDDLERISSTVNIEDVLGYINRFVEHQRIKTIIISNETEISKLRPSQNETDKQSIDRYGIVKEKLVGWTFELKPDIDQILDSFIDEDKTGFIADQLKASRSIFAAFSSQEIAFNARSIRIAVDVFATALYTLKKQGIELPGFESELLRVLLFCTIEMKRNTSVAPLIEKLFGGEGAHFRLYFGDKTPEKDELSALLEKYQIQIGHLGFKFSSLFDYLMGGTLDLKTLVQEGRTIEQALLEKPDPYDAYLSNVFSMDEEEFPKVHTYYFKSVKAPTITDARQLILLAAAMYFHAKARIIDETEQQVHQLFIDTFNHLKDEGRLDIINYEIHTPRFAYEDISGFQELHRQLIDIINQVREAKKQRHLDDLPHRLKSSPEETIDRLKKDPDFDITNPFLARTNIDSLASTILEFSQQDLEQFSQWMLYRYSPSNIHQYLSQEIPMLEKLISFIEASERIRERSFFGHKLRYFMERLNGAVARMKQHLGSDGTRSLGAS